MTAHTEVGSLDELGVPEPECTPEQARAYTALQHAIHDAFEAGRVTPCVADPQSWDATDVSVTRAELARVGRLCRQACPVLAKCKAYRATNPPVTGVLAGRYLPHHNDKHPAASTKDAWVRGLTVASAFDATDDADHGRAA